MIKFKDNLNKIALPITAMLNIAFIALFLFTFDAYSTNFVTPETPFYNIAEVPFSRMEFIITVFSLSLAAGVAAGCLLKKRVYRLVPICTAIIGILALVIGVFDVDMAQKLFPTMRISHVIMTVSRLTGIMLGVSGLFVGISAAALIRQVRALPAGMAIGAVMALFAIAQSCYTILYIAFGVVLMLAAIFTQYAKCAPSSDEHAPRFLKVSLIGDNIRTFIKSGLIVMSLMVYYAFTSITLRSDPITFALTISVALIMALLAARMRTNIIIKSVVAVIAVIALIVTVVIPNALLSAATVLLAAIAIGLFHNGAVVCKPYNPLPAAGAGAFIFAIIGVAINHSMANIITHSGNRVYIEVSEYALLILGAFAVLLVAIPYIVGLVNAKLIKTDPAQIAVIEAADTVTDSTEPKSE